MNIKPFLNYKHAYNKLGPLESCPKCEISPNMVTLTTVFMDKLQLTGKNLGQVLNISRTIKIF
jgi:hypothetical protein